VANKSYYNIYQYDKLWQIQRKTYRFPKQRISWPVEYLSIAQEKPHAMKVTSKPSLTYYVSSVAYLVP